VTGLRAGQPRARISILSREKNLNLLIASTSSVEPTQPHIQWAERVKRPKPETDPSYIYSRSLRGLENYINFPTYRHGAFLN